MYLDEISNDAIKCGIQRLEAPLLHLYNQVLNTGCFPHIWSDGLIIPLHKKNDKSCVDDYRGLILSSCVGKLFTKILTKRIDTFMRINGLWIFNQCGFKADHRTEDNLFILNTLMGSMSIWKAKQCIQPLLIFQNSLIKSMPVKRNQWYYRKAISLVKISDMATQISSVWNPYNICDFQSPIT